MPQRKDVHWSQLKVGIVSIVSLTLLAATIFLVTGQAGLFSKSMMLHTYTPDAAGLKSGAVVRLAGVDVGNVQTVHLSNRPDTNESVEIVMKVTENFSKDIREDSEVILAAEGLLGERYINITRGTQAAQPIAPGGTIKFHQTAEFSELVGSSRDLLDNLNVLTSRLNSIVGSIDSGEGTVGKLIKDDSLFRRLDATVNSAQTLVAELNDGKGTLGQLLKSDEFANQATNAVRQLQAAIAKIDSGDGTVAKLINDPTLYRDAQQLMAKSSLLMDNINQGKGTLGKLATDEEFYRKLNSAVGNVDGVMVGLRNGEGTMGRLFQDPSLYNGLNATTTEVRELLADFRKDPKKFLTIHFRIF